MKKTLLMKFAAIAFVAVCGLFASNDAHAQAPWQACGNEGDTCLVRGFYDLAYGDGTYFAYVYGANVPGSFVCRWQTFGTDPAPGRFKSCFVRPTGAPPPPPPPPPPPGRWQFCSDEGFICRVPGGRPTTVRFGPPGGPYILRYNQVALACTIQVFGYDPAPGYRKTCDWSY